MLIQQINQILIYIQQVIMNKNLKKLKVNFVKIQTIQNELLHKTAKSLDLMIRHNVTRL
jgi:hypothetical protein